MENEIEIYYHYSKLDKKHCYSVVCKQRNDSNYGNYWIWWLWYKMGVAFGESEKRKFNIYPFAMEYNNQKLIKAYKTLNIGTDRVAAAILSHFKKIKQSKIKNQ